MLQMYNTVFLRFCITGELFNLTGSADDCHINCQNIKLELKVFQRIHIISKN